MAGQLSGRFWTTEMDRAFRLRMPPILGISEQHFPGQMYPNDLSDIVFLWWVLMTAQDRQADDRQAGCQAWSLDNFDLSNLSTFSSHAMHEMLMILGIHRQAACTNEEVYGVDNEEATTGFYLTVHNIVLHESGSSEARQK